MANFLTTKQVASEIEEIIKKAKQKLYIVTPYLRLSSTFYERLSEAIERGVDVLFIYGKTDLSPQDQELINNLNINVYYKDNLHAKCYANEEKALVTSMNLHSYSEANNRELGVLLNRKEDKEAYNDCVAELESIILSSLVEKRVEENFKENTPIQYEYVDFVFEWAKYLKKKFADSKFSIKEDIIYSEGFPKHPINFSNEYGFVTLSLYSKDIENLEKMRSKHSSTVSKVLNEYRLYWNQGYEHYPSRICLYEARNLRFDNLDEKIQYCSKGLEILLKELDEIF